MRHPHNMSFPRYQSWRPTSHQSVPWPCEEQNEAHCCTKYTGSGILFNVKQLLAQFRCNSIKKKCITRVLLKFVNQEPYVRRFKESLHCRFTSDWYVIGGYLPTSGRVNLPGHSFSSFLSNQRAVTLNMRIAQSSWLVMDSICNNNNLI